MKFQPGNKLSKGGKRNPPGGRPTKEEQAAKVEMRRAAIEALTTGMTQAVKTLMRHLDSENENVAVRAAESVIEYALKSYESDEIERRLVALEQRLEDRRVNYAPQSTH